MTEMMGMPPVEPLSDLEWKRIEEGLMARLDRDTGPVVLPAPAAIRSSWKTAVGWTTVGAIGTIAATVIAFLALAPDAAQERTLAHSSRVTTAESASVVTLRDSTLTVAPQSALFVNEDQQGGVLVVLEQGSAHFAVAPRAGRPPFVVNAGVVRIEVIGTHFGVSREGDGASVTVDTGVVTVISRGVRHEIGPGGRFPRTPKAAATRDTEASDEAPPAVEPAAVAEGSPEPVKQPRRSRPAAVSAKDRYRSAASIEGRDPKGALAIYSEIADAGGPWAPLALFAKGRLELDLGQTATGTRTLRAYLDRYPDGPNAADARALLR